MSSRFDTRPRNKYDSPYYDEYPQLKARGISLDQARENKAIADKAIREELRIQFQKAHGNSCPVAKASRIPFESCGGCRKAFEDEYARRTGNEPA